MLAKAIDYMLKRCPSFGRFLDDGRICLSNNDAERAFRKVDASFVVCALILRSCDTVKAAPNIL